MNASRSAERAALWIAAATSLLLLAGAGLVGLPWGTIAEVLGGAPGAVLVAVAGALLLALVTVWAGWRQTRGGRVRWGWTALLIVVPIIALTAAGLVVLLAAVPVDPQRPEVKVDLIKTALSVGAGTGGVVALVLAGRRGWSTEHDATERRITELYTKAVEQLGSDKAPVRLGGLYALERLAQANPGNRQTIVEVICAYLRMPYTAPQPGAPRRLGLPRPVRPGHRHTHHRRPEPAPSATVTADRSIEERQVRLTAQRILEDHLQPGSRRPRWRCEPPRVR